MIVSLVSTEARLVFDLGRLGMVKFKERAKRIPGVAPLYRKLRSYIGDMRLRRKSVEHVFEDIVVQNQWGGAESVSGRGSDIDQARAIIAALPELFGSLSIHSILDIPCGDFSWMKHVDLDGIDYLGADIVTQLIVRNASVFETDNVRFRRLDLLTDELPGVDLVICRDCLVHFSYRDVFRALRSICSSGATYALTTTFTDRKKNSDIVTGRWRPLNLEIAPFELPPPLRLINEGSMEGGGAYRDKSLGLWRVADVRERLVSGSTVP